MSVLPREIDYSSKLHALPPQTSCLSAVVSPSNGSTFSAGGGEIIMFDLPARSFLVPGSLYLRYKLAVVNGTTADFLLGTPFATPFARLETLIGSQNVESISGYNALYNMIVNTKLNLAQKAGMATNLGLLDMTTAQDFTKLNGRNIPASATTSISLAAPLGCILSNCSELVPLCFMPSVRIQLTTEAISKMVQIGTSVTGYTLSNLELCFDIIDFGPEVESVCASMANADGNIMLKSQSFVSSSQSIAGGAIGQIELVFNQRLSSIKSIFALLQPQNLTKTFGSKDITKSSGDYQFLVASMAYPPRPLSALNNNSGILMELLNSWGPSHDITSNNCSISPVEWARVADSGDTAQLPGKFIVGVNTERLSTNSSLLTGISSQLSPISFRINMGSAVSTEAFTCTLISCYDALLEINPATRQASVKQ